MARYLRLVPVMLIIFFTFFVIYTPHFNYAVPFHVDEWRHISEAKRIYEGSEYGAYTCFEIGFHMALSSVYFAGIDIVLIYKYLPAVFACISAAIIFIILSKKFNYITGLCGMLFFASLRSNVNLLGSWFFTPLTFALPFMLLFAYFFTEGIERHSNKKFIISLAFLLLTFFSHPITATFLIPAVAIYVCIKRDFFRQNCRMVQLLAGTALIGFLFFIIVSWKGSFFETFSFLLKQLYFPYGWGNYEKIYSVPGYFNIVLFIFAIIGAYFSVRKKQYFFLLWAATTLLFVWLFPIIKFSLFAPYQRMFFYTLVALSMLAAIGFCYTWIILRNSMPYLKSHSIISGVIFALLLLFLVLYIFKGYNVMPEDVMLYAPLELDDLRAVVSLKGLPSSVVLARAYLSTAIYPLTGHSPVATPYFYGNSEARDDLNSFFSSNCTVQEEIIEKYNASYVISPDEIECSWQVFYKGNRFIYAFT